MINPELPVPREELNKKRRRKAYDGASDPCPLLGIGRCSGGGGNDR